MATPHAVLKHGHGRVPTAITGRSRRRLGRVRSSLLVGIAAALPVTALPVGAAASPGEAASPEQTAQLVAEASHQLEVVTEELNQARVLLDQQRAAAASAAQKAEDERARLDALGGQVRQLARSAYTSGGLTQLDVMLTSGSAEEFVSQLSTLEAIAGHTNDLVTEVADTAERAEAARRDADQAAAAAQRAVEEITARQREFEGQIAEYQRQYAALTASQQTQVLQSEGGPAAAVPAGVPASNAAAQTAVDTALAQVGDPYVWGAAGPDSFDCSGLTLFAYAAAGVNLPHSSRIQATMGRPVAVSELQPGDLLFFYSPISHESMYIGNGMMVHAATSGTPVRVVPLSSMQGDLTAARRVVG